MLIDASWRAFFTSVDGVKTIFRVVIRLEATRFTSLTDFAFTENPSGGEDAGGSGSGGDDLGQ